MSEFDKRIKSAPKRALFCLKNSFKFFLKDIFETERIRLGNFFGHFDEHFYFRQSVVVFSFIEISQSLVELIVDIFYADMGNPDVKPLFFIFPKCPDCLSVLIGSRFVFCFVVERFECRRKRVEGFSHRVDVVGGDTDNQCQRDKDARQSFYHNFSSH